MTLCYPSFFQFVFLADFVLLGLGFFAVVTGWGFFNQFGVNVDLPQNFLVKHRGFLVV